MTYIRRGGLWWVRWRDPDGAEVEEETPLAGTEPLEVVKAFWVARQEGGVVHSLEISSLGAAKTAQVADLAGLLETEYRIQERRTLPRALAVLRRFTAAVGPGTPLEALSTCRLAQWVAVRCEEISHGTVRTELQIIHRAMSLAALYDKIPKVPTFPKVKPSPARKGFLEPEDLEAILQHLPPGVRALVEFLAWTGWRANEARRLQWSAVDWTAGEVRLEGDETKEAAPRVFPFGQLPQLEAVLRGCRERVDTLQKLYGRAIPWVFVNTSGSPIGYDGLKYQWIKARTRAGLPAKLIHDLRRSAAKLLSSAGVPVQVAMSLLGHRTLAMWRRYGIATDQACREGVARLAEHIRRRSQGGT